jgi:hypothetical protein
MAGPGRMIDSAELIDGAGPGCGILMDCGVVRTVLLERNWNVDGLLLILSSVGIAEDQVRAIGIALSLLMRTSLLTLDGLANSLSIGGIAGCLFFGNPT